MPSATQTSAPSSVSSAAARTGSMAWPTPKRKGPDLRLARLGLVLIAAIPVVTLLGAYAICSALTAPAEPEESVEAPLPPPPPLLELRPAPRALTPFERTAKDVQAFQRFSVPQESFARPAEKPFAGPGSYAVVFSKSPDLELRTRWTEAGIEFGDGADQRSYLVTVTTPKAYEMLNCMEVERVAPHTLFTAAKETNKRNWRAN
jgi:hypothetical protein